MLIDRNKEVSKNIQIIAPGQGKFPAPWITPNIDEICFPKIFVGELCKVASNVSYTNRAKSEARRVDRRSCETKRILNIWLIVN